MRKILICSLVFASLLIFSSYANALCVNVPIANLREGPGTNYQKTWEVLRYMPLKKIGEKKTNEGKWFNVEDVDGDVYWIHSKLVTFKFNCAVVKVEEVNIRKGPGTNYRKNPNGPGTRYDSFKVIGRKGKWVKVQNEYQGVGWIFRKYVWIY